MGNLSEHFDLEEFAYHGTPAPEGLISPILIEGLERLRETCGRKPLHITPGGGWRPSEKDRSFYKGHSRGLAADVTAPHLSLRDLHELASMVRVFRISGIGLYPQGNFIHVDVGRPTPARWVRIGGLYYNY